MNSNSNYLDSSFDYCRRPDGGKKDRRSSASALMKCSSPGSVIIPALADTGSVFTPASLTLNTRGICNPCTRIDFTSNLTLPEGFVGTLSFQVYKQCRNQMSPVPIGPAYTFSRTLATTTGESNTFTFFICDCDSCDNDCCTYSVVITNLSAITLGLTVNNATLSAITTSQICNPCC